MRLPWARDSKKQNSLHYAIKYGAPLKVLELLSFGFPLSQLGVFVLSPSADPMLLDVRACVLYMSVCYATYSTTPSITYFLQAVFFKRNVLPRQSHKKVSIDCN